MPCASSKGELNARTGEHVTQPCSVQLEPSGSEFPRVRPSLTLPVNQGFVNRSLVMLFFCVWKLSFQKGTYLPQTYIIQEEMIATEHVHDMEQLGSFIYRLCSGKETYRLKRRSARRRKSPAAFSHPNSPSPCIPVIISALTAVLASLWWEGRCPCGCKHTDCFEVFPI